jgi:hypothetical protein
MNADIKARLLEHRKKSRGVLLKDCTPDDFRVAADHAKLDSQCDDPEAPFADDEFVAYLKYATLDQVQALASCSTHAVVGHPVARHNAFRPVTVFHSDFLYEVVKFLVTVKLERYIGSRTFNFGYYRIWSGRLPHVITTAHTFFQYAS